MTTPTSTETQELEEFKRYLVLEHSLSEKTATSHTYQVGKFLDDTGVRNPQREDVLEYKEKMMKDGYSNSHINNTMKALEYYFNFLGKTLNISKLKRQKKLPNPLSEEEIKTLLKNTKTKRDEAIFHTLLSTGLRASELCNLNRRDVDLEERIVKVRSGKGGKDGYAIMSEECAKAIQKYLATKQETETNALFLNMYGERLTRSGLLQLVKRTAERANLDRNVNVHTFRHTFGTRMISNGADISVVKELMRHNDIRTTMLYVTLSQKTLKEQYDKHFTPTTPD